MFVLILGLSKLMFSKGRVKNLSCAGERAAEVERAVREHERNQPGGRSVFNLFGIQQGLMIQIPGSYQCNESSRFFTTHLLSKLG